MKTFAWRLRTGGVVPACTRLLLHGGRVSVAAAHSKVRRRDGQREFIFLGSPFAPAAQLGGGLFLAASHRVTSGETLPLGD
jgi:hypothetical protein